MAISGKVRKIVAEDINFGTEQVVIERSDGTTVNASQVNASHIPTSDGRNIEEIIKAVGYSISEFDGLPDAVAKIGDKNATLVVDKEVELNQDLTIPENICLKFLKGGKIIVNDGYTLIINGVIEAGLWKIFDGDGTITGNPKIDAVYPEWFGAKGDGVNDDTVAIQKAVNIGGTVIFTKTYKITSQINISKSFTKIIGVGGKIFANFTGGYVFSFIGDGTSLDTYINGIEVSDMYIYTDNITRPDGFYFKYVNDAKIENCYLKQLLNGIVADYCPDMKISKSYFTGQATGITLTHCRDSKITNCHLWGGENGIRLLGTFDVGLDGGYTVDNVTINIMTNIGIDMTEVYTPAISNLIIEKCKIAININSSQYGVLDNVFIGPCDSHAIYANVSSINNDFWIIRGIVAQNQFELHNMNFLILEEISFLNVSITNTGGTLYLGYSEKVNVSNIKFHNTKTYHAILTEGTTFGNFSNIIADKQMFINWNGILPGQYIIKDCLFINSHIDRYGGFGSEANRVNIEAQYYVANGNTIQEVYIGKYKLDNTPTMNYYYKGDIVYNGNVAPGGKIGWVCVRSGEAAPIWKASTSYNVGDKIIPTSDNGYYYECIVAGTSGSAEPVWPTKVGDTVADGTVTWECKGISAMFKEFGTIAP